MNKFPIVDMLAIFTRYAGLDNPDWRLPYRRDVAQVRSCHSKIEGGVRKSFYTIETKSGDILDLIFDEEELVWTLAPATGYEGKSIDRLLTFVQRHKHLPSRAHRVVPYRFELLPEELAKKHYDGTERPLIQRMQPYRFQSGKINSAQVTKIPTRHLEPTMITKELNYVVETDGNRFFHLVYILDEMDWRFMQEVDEEFFFVH